MNCNPELLEKSFTGRVISQNTTATFSHDIRNWCLWPAGAAVFYVFCCLVFVWRDAEYLVNVSCTADPNKTRHYHIFCIKSTLKWSIFRWSQYFLQSCEVTVCYSYSFLKAGRVCCDFVKCDMCFVCAGRTCAALVTTHTAVPDGRPWPEETSALSVSPHQLPVWSVLVQKMILQTGD